jgi:hypothetical protein
MSSAGLSIERSLQRGNTVATRDHRDQDSLPESVKLRLKVSAQIIRLSRSDKAGRCSVHRRSLGAQSTSWGRTQAAS